jgi:hypothetical protein
MPFKSILLATSIVMVFSVPSDSLAVDSGAKVYGDIVMQKDSSDNHTGIIFSNGDVMRASAKDGKSVLSGSGNPDAKSVTGNIGDFYIDTVSNMLYGPYAGSWGSGISLIGPQGQPGSKGDKGDNGLPGPVGPGITWQSITSAITAISNVGYIPSNDASQVTITLPENPVVGDITWVNGAGLGGWKVQTNSGQTITSGSVEGVTWVPRESSRAWGSITSSSDGSKLAATVSNGKIYTSTDYGMTWTPRGISKQWTSITSSADGTKLAAVQSNDGYVYLSSNSGVTWNTSSTGIISQYLSSITSSADGLKLALTTAGGKIYTNNSGWMPQNNAPSVNWAAIASSADGTKLIAAASSYFLFTSPDSGVTWTGRLGSALWKSVTSSSDGSTLAAVGTDTQINLSKDSGVTWTAQGPNANWSSITSSSDGTIIAAAENGGYIHISTNSGLTWKAQIAAGARNWSSITSSFDGTKLVAVTGGGQIYVYSKILSNLYGGPEDLIQLMCIATTPSVKFKIIYASPGVLWQ